ncbi:hypothetical protein [Thermus caldilimi]|uniref:hypothetical protein n=1 Tax=Thermus caldilimi TaxID=2483360 RepID=UPI0010763C10|nr:hypothetical protein [Thermus caldilimi]
MQAQGLEKRSPKRAVALTGGARLWGFFGEVILSEGKAVRIVLRKGKEGWQAAATVRSTSAFSENPNLLLLLTALFALSTLWWAGPSRPEYALMPLLVLAFWTAVLQPFPQVLRHHALEHRVLEAVARWCDGERWEDDYRYLAEEVTDWSWACGSVLFAAAALVAIPLFLVLPPVGVLPLALALGDQLRGWARSRPHSPLHRLLLRIQLLFLRPPTEEELRAGAVAVRRAVELCGKAEPGSR